MDNKIDKKRRDPATLDLCMIKHRQETDGCPTRKYCVELWGGEETFNEIRNLTKFELVYQKDSLIYKKDDPVTSLYMVQSGAIKLEKEVEGGHNHVSGFYFTGDLIGLESMGLEQHRYNAVALKETWICEIRLKKLAELDMSASPILQRINEQLGRNYRQLDEHIYSSHNLYAEQRLLGFINILCEKYHAPTGGNSNELLLPMTKTDIANYLGMQPASLSRAFRQLENEGILKSSHNTKKIVIDKNEFLKCRSA